MPESVVEDTGTGWGYQKLISLWFAFFVTTFDFMDYNMARAASPFA